MNQDEAESHLTELRPDYGTQIRAALRSFRREIQENPAVCSPEARKLFESVNAPPDLEEIYHGEFAVLYLEDKSLLPENPSP